MKNIENTKLKYEELDNLVLDAMKDAEIDPQYLEHIRRLCGAESPWGKLSTVDNELKLQYQNFLTSVIKIAQVETAQTVGTIADVLAGVQRAELLIPKILEVIAQESRKGNNVSLRIVEMSMRFTNCKTKERAQQLIIEYVPIQPKQNIGENPLTLGSLFVTPLRNQMLQFKKEEENSKYHEQNVLKEQLEKKSIPQSVYGQCESGDYLKVIQGIRYLTEHPLDECHYNINQSQQLYVHCARRYEEDNKGKQKTEIYRKLSEPGVNFFAEAIRSFSIILENGLLASKITSKENLPQIDEEALRKIPPEVFRDIFWTMNNLRERYPEQLKDSDLRQCIAMFTTLANEAASAENTMYGEGKKFFAGFQTLCADFVKAIEKPKFQSIFTE